MILTQSQSFVSILFAISFAFQNTGLVNGYDWTCNLFCYNGGTCRHGHGKFGAYAGVDSVTDKLPFEQELHDDGMYCTCPEGFTGLQCEIKYVTCGRDDHTCFNGSACVKERSSDTGKVFYRCECDVEDSVMDAPYAGKYCEHIATIFCEGGDGFNHGSSFCTNGGKCKNREPDSDKKHHGCDCPDGWEGDHCELAIKKSASLAGDIAHGVAETLSGDKIVWIIIFSVIGIFSILYFRRYHLIKQRAKRGNRRRRKQHQQEMASYNDDSRDII